MDEAILTLEEAAHLHEHLEGGDAPDEAWRPSSATS
jgi:hypothetical protein